MGPSNPLRGIEEICAGILIKQKKEALSEQAFGFEILRIWVE